MAGDCAGETENSEAGLARERLLQNISGWLREKAFAAVQATTDE